MISDGFNVKLPVVNGSMGFLLGEITRPINVLYDLLMKST